MDYSNAAQISIYDEVAFPSYPYPQSHPERLATIGRLKGVVGASLEGCRVLELGCGGGGNLLPIADSIPTGEFVGIDLSSQQIEQARAVARLSGLANVDLKVEDILSLDATLGKFDFIIAHGLFSWTTEEVREQILQLCRDLLSPAGIAYINYNTFPGWHIQGMLRDMLFFQAQHCVAPEERVREARRMLDFLQHTLPPASHPFGGFLRAELEAIRNHSDAFLFHAYLNVFNQPFYLHEFQRRATDCELRFLGDADPALNWLDRSAPQLFAQIRQLTDDEARWNQHLDFVRFTASRRSLVCHQDVTVEESPSLSALRDFHVSAALRRQQTAPGSPVGYLLPDGRRITVNNTRMNATLELLADAWPESVPFAELSSYADGQASPSADERERWEQELIHGFCTGVIHLSVHANRCTRSVSNLPLASPLARLQAGQQEFVANTRHMAVRLSELERRCLDLLDGRTSVEQLSNQLGPDAQPILVRLAANSLLLKT